MDFAATFTAARGANERGPQRLVVRPFRHPPYRASLFLLPGTSARRRTEPPPHRHGPRVGFPLPGHLRHVPTRTSRGLPIMDNRQRQKHTAVCHHHRVRVAGGPPPRPPPPKPAIPLDHPRPWAAAEPPGAPHHTRVTLRTKRH